MDMTILAYDPFLTTEKAESLGVKLVDLDRIITESDFITVHTPLTPETKGIFGAKEFARMKKGVRLINWPGAVFTMKPLWPKRLKADK